MDVDGTAAHATAAAAAVCIAGEEKRGVNCRARFLVESSGQDSVWVECGARSLWLKEGVGQAIGVPGLVCSSLSFLFFFLWGEIEITV